MQAIQLEVYVQSTTRTQWLEALRFVHTQALGQPTSNGFANPSRNASRYILFLYHRHNHGKTKDQNGEIRYYHHLTS